MTIVVQVAGKLRAQIQAERDISEEAAVATAQQDGNVAKFLEGKQIVKTIFVPNKLINFVVR